AANVSVMSAGELNDFITEAKKVLEELRENIDSSKVAGEANVTTSLAERLRNRLERILGELNITEGELHEIRERLRHAWSLGHLKKILEDLRPIIRPAKALNLTETLLSFANRSAEHGNATGLERALNSSCKVLDVLAGVKEKLEKLNASPAAIMAIEHAIEKISEMRELLASVKEKVHELRQHHNATCHEIREIVKNKTRKGLQQAEEKLEEYVKELEELRETALEKGLTDLADEFSALLSKLRGLSDRIRNGNFTFKQAVGILAEAKRMVEKAEKALEEASERKELREVVSEQLRERMHSLERQRDRLKEKLKELEKELPESMKDFLEEVQNMILNLSDKLQKARENLSIGRGSTTLNILKDAEKNVSVIEEKLNVLENQIKNRAMGHRGSGHGAGR
ncbi:MAG: hypothetical protein J7K49_07640, partial [Thaumarchaeota archaeon]|nr:hypothetical protein [Nitrososphaerota archaeon]